MKKQFQSILATLFLTSPTAYGQHNAFITTWQVEGGDLTVTIPTTGGGYNYTVDWGEDSDNDGINETSQNVTGNAEHTYAAAGTYTIRIYGDFPRIFFDNGGDRNKMQTVEQWGDIKWQSMRRAFAGCSNFVLLLHVSSSIFSSKRS